MAIIPCLVVYQYGLRDHEIRGIILGLGCRARWNIDVPTCGIGLPNYMGQSKQSGTRESALTVTSAPWYE